MKLHRKIRSHAASGGNWVCSSDPCHVASCLGMPLGKRDWSWFTNINLRQESKYIKRHQYTMTMDSRMSRPTPSVRISFLSESPIEVDAPLFKLESPCESCDDRFAYIYILSLHPICLSLLATNRDAPFVNPFYCIFFWFHIQKFQISTSGRHLWASKIPDPKL